MQRSTHRRNTDVSRLGATAGIASSRFAHRLPRLRSASSSKTLGACTQLTPEETTRRRNRRLATTPIPASNGRPKARNKEGSCGSVLY